MFIKTRKALNALHPSSHFEAAFQVAFKSANGQKDWVKASCFPRYFPTACLFSRPFFTCDVCFLVWFIGLTLYTLLYVRMSNNCIAAVKSSSS